MTPANEATCWPVVEVFAGPEQQQVCEMTGGGINSITGLVGPRKTCVGRSLARYWVSPRSKSPEAGIARGLGWRRAGNDRNEKK